MNHSFAPQPHTTSAVSSIHLLNTVTSYASRDSNKKQNNPYTNDKDWGNTITSPEFSEL